MLRNFLEIRVLVRINKRIYFEVGFEELEIGKLFEFFLVKEELN